MPQEFDFYQDAKGTIWQRSHFIVTAESYDEAVEKLKALKDKDLTEDMYDGIDFIESEMLFDTAQRLSLEANQGHSTLEIFYSETGEDIAGNGQPTGLL